MTVPALNTSHLSPADVAELHQVMRLTQAPISARDRERLRRDTATDRIMACAKRKGLDVSPFPLMCEASAGQAHFELGCWLHYYNRRVGDAGAWARIDCMRRLLLSDYPSFNPHYDFHTVFDFGEREFDTCFEMCDGSDVLRALVSLRSVPAVAAKFAEAGWTELYLENRGYLQPAEHGQADLFAA
jgi:hypothetical protein